MRQITAFISRFFVTFGLSIPFLPVIGLKIFVSCAIGTKSHSWMNFHPGCMDLLVRTHLCIFLWMDGIHSFQLEHHASAVDNIVDKIADEHKELNMQYRTNGLLKQAFIHLHREGMSTHHLCLLMHRRCCKAMAFNVCTPAVAHCRVRLLVGVTLGEGRQNQKVNFRFWAWGNSTGKTIPSNSAALMNATQLVIFDVLKIRDKEDVPNAHYHVLAYS